MSQPDPNRSFRLLFVCTGNICRSPYAEILMRHLLIGRLGGRAAATLTISSAGTHAVEGAPMHPYTRAELAPWRLDTEAAARFAARRMRSSFAAQANLVLGANPEHRSMVVQQAPVALGWTFTLRDFARLAAAVDPAVLPTDPVARAHRLVEQATLLRGVLPAQAPDESCIPDPMGRERPAHHEAAVLIQVAVQTIVNAIAPALQPRQAVVRAPERAGAPPRRRPPA